MQLWTKLCIRVLSFIAWILPQRVHWWVGGFLAWLWFDVLRLRRYTIMKNLSIAFPEWPAEKKYQIARKSMRYLCYSFPEFLTLPMMKKENDGKTVFFSGLEHYENALKKNKGVFLLTLHMGNGDIGASALSLRGYVVHLISKKFSNKFSNNFWFGIRGNKGVRFIDAHSPRNAFQILSAVRRNESVLFVVDQFMGKPFGVETTFFGRKTGTAYGLAVFAERSQTPVIPVYVYRDKDFICQIQFDPEIPYVEMQDRDLQIQSMTQRYNDKLEEIVRRHPEQWMWVHRRWKRWK
jgi:KDO2-lipid IV(A) lauroyltransferase